MSTGTFSEIAAAIGDYLTLSWPLLSNVAGLPAYPADRN
jgi:hypothetical protein